MKKERASLGESESSDERGHMGGKAGNEVRRFSELEVVELKGRCTSASYKRVVGLSIPGWSSEEFTLQRDGEIVSGKRTKPDVGRDSVLWYLVVAQIGSKAGQLHTPIFLIQLHYLLAD